LLKVIHIHLAQLLQEQRTEHRPASVPNPPRNAISANGQSNMVLTPVSGSASR